MRETGVGIDGQNANGCGSLHISNQRFRLGLSYIHLFGGNKLNVVRSAFFTKYYDYPFILEVILNKFVFLSSHPFTS